MKKIINSPVKVGSTLVTIIPNFQGIHGLNGGDLLKYHNIGKWAITIGHDGNSADKLIDIDNNLKLVFGADVTIDKIKKHCIKFTERGKPNYYYSFSGLLDVKFLTELAK